MTIEKVAVIGSGTMGMGIAAQIANAGVPVRLLDIVPKAASDRSAIAKGAIQKALKTDPAPFMDPKNAALIEPGNIEDDLDSLGDCDWIVEVVLEDLGIKRSLYEKLEAVRKPGAIVTSNTSTIPLGMLVEGRSQDFAKHFAITHFFNPPRYLRLLELVTGPQTDPGAAETLAAFCDLRLGKSVIRAKDSPAFIANRIGTFWMQIATNAAFDFDLTVEEADAIGSRPMGIPKTGTFGLLDLVGIDLGPLLAKSLLGSLPEGDAYREIYREQPLIDKMIADGYTGRKGKGGFYRRRNEAGERVREAIDLKTGAYRDEQKASLASLDASKMGGLRALVEHDDKGGRYAWHLVSHGLAYAAALLGRAADTPEDIDRAMVLGYNWKAGPFALIDRLGTGWFKDKLEAEGRAVPEILRVADGRPIWRVEDGRLEYLNLDGAYHQVVRPEGVLLLEDIQRASKPVAKNASAALWDLGDGALCLEFRSKMNTIDPEIMAMIRKAIALIGDGGGDYKALVVYNEGSNFSVGANLGLFLFALNIGLYPQLEAQIAEGQDAYRALRYAPFPVVGAPAGMALGGGCEILLHCDTVEAAAESYIGLVEVGVGVIPGWGGSATLLARHLANKKRPHGAMPALQPAFQTIATAQVAKSAVEAKKMLLLPGDAGVVMNRDRLLYAAKQRALGLVDGYEPPEPPVFHLPGPGARAAVTIALRDQAKLNRATKHDVVVLEELAWVLSGGETDPIDELSEDDLYRMEREAFMRLVKTEGTVARIEHMLETGKPLRN